MHLLQYHKNCKKKKEKKLPILSSSCHLDVKLIIKLGTPCDFDYSGKIINETK